MMTRRVFLGMAGVAGAGLWLGVPGLAQAAVSRETKVMLGTFVDVSVAGVSSMQASDALGLAFAEASRLERVFSRHDGGTPVSELNRAGRLRAAPAELVRVVNRSLFYGALTGGSFDVTVQPVIDLFRAHRNPSGELTLDDSELRAARALVGRRGLQVSGADLSFARSGMGITLDGIAKGYIADRVSAVLTSAGVKNHLVNAGGDIMASGHKSPGVPWRVAVQSPTGPAYAGELSLSGKAIATSGSYEIYYDASRRHHHLINPVSGFSPAVGSVSVVAGTAMEADILATALSILPPSDALKLVQGLPGRECCILSPDGCIYTSPGWAPLRLGTTAELFYWQAICDESFSCACFFAIYPSGYLLGKDSHTPPIKLACSSGDTVARHHNPETVRSPLQPVLKTPGNNQARCISCQTATRIYGKQTGIVHNPKRNPGLLQIPENVWHGPIHHPQAHFFATLCSEFWKKRRISVFSH